MQQQSPLRHVVIGVGAGIFATHRRALETETAELVAVSDIDATRGQPLASELGCPFYADHRAMLADTQPDVAVVLTPHPFHAAIAIDCFEAGCHVLVEKPMAVQVAEADAMIDAAARADRLLAVNFQQRFRPEVQAAYGLIQQGGLGDIQYAEMMATWTRTAIYYELARWRGTWNGEGGGVLLNQAPHELDLLCYLVGAPSRVVAWTRTQIHAIETEDTAHAMLEWPGGAWGSVHTSTAEAGQKQRLEVAGTKGWLQLDRDGLTFARLDTDLHEFIAHNPGPYAAPGKIPTPVELEPGAGNHASVYRNLHAAILSGAPLVCDGVEGRKSLELANAMIYSSHLGQEVKLPLDRQQYAELLDDLKSGLRPA
jgi:predicted dehydrogenase